MAHSLQEKRLSRYTAANKGILLDFLPVNLMCLSLDEQEVVESPEKIKPSIKSYNEATKSVVVSYKEAKALRQELKSHRDNNLKNNTFNERVDLVARLGIKIYPSEDRKSRRISCELNIRDIGEQVGVAKEVYGRPCRSRTCDTLII